MRVALPRRRSRVALLAGGAAASAAVLGYIASPAAAVPVVGVLASAALALARRAEVFAYLAIVFAFTVFPDGVPFFVYVGGVQLYLYEPFLVFALAWSLTLFRSITFAMNIFLIGMLVATAWSLGGLASGSPFSFINADVRPLVDLCMAIPVAAAMVATGRARHAFRVIVVVLWVSAAMTALSSATGLKLVGREEAATLNFSGSTSDDATRFLTTATDLAIVVLSGVLMSALVYRLRVGWLVIATPAFVIVFFAFSRNSLLGVAAALVVAFLWAAADSRLKDSLLRLLVVLFVLVALFLVTQFAPGLLTSVGWLRVQLDAVSQRVFGGISASALSSDPSANYRALEITYLVPAIAQSPLVGHGFGYAYKPPLGSGLGFFAVQGRYYAHQYYLWLAVKVGILGSGLLYAGWIAAAARGVRARGAVTLGLVAGLAAALTISAVAPMPNGEPGVLVVGGVLGALASWKPSVALRHLGDGKLEGAGVDPVRSE